MSSSNLFRYSPPRPFLPSSQCMRTPDRTTSCACIIFALPPRAFQIESSGDHPPAASLLHCITLPTVVASHSFSKSLAVSQPKECHASVLHRAIVMSTRAVASPRVAGAVPPAGDLPLTFTLQALAIVHICQTCNRPRGLRSSDISNTGHLDLARASDRLEPRQQRLRPISTAKASD